VAFPDGWAHRVAITIDAGDIDADLTSWTLVFDQSFASVLTQVNGPLDADGTRASLNGGGDVRFSSDAAGANQLACDIRDWTTNNNPASATCEVAVGGSGLDPSSSSDTTIYMWWGKSGETQPGAATTYGQYNAYDSYHVLVSPCACAVNRTSTSLTFSEVGSPTTGQAAKVGTGTLYDNPNNGGEYVEIDQNSPFNFDYDDEITLECCASKTGTPGVPMMLLAHIREDTLYEGYSLYYHDQTGVKELQWTMHPAAGSLQGAEYPLTWGSGTFFHLGATYDGSNSPTGMICYVNGSEPTGKQENNTDLSAGITHDDGFRIAARGWGTSNSMREWYGVIDEARVSNFERSAAWISANYHNQFNTSGFLTWGSITDIADDLTASDLTAGTPTLETPTLGQEHDLTAAEISAGSPALETPTLGQTHDLTAAELAAGTPTLGTPTLAEAVDELTASDLAAGTPTLESPTLGQHHTLSAVEISSGAPTLESPSIGQTHQLSASEVTTGAPALDTPTLSTEGTDALVAADLTAGAPVLDSPDLGQEHALAAAELAAGAPTLEEPALGQTHELTAVEVTAGAPALETPTLSEAGHALAADPITTGAPTLETPTLGQTHALSALEIATGAPELAEPSLGQTHVLTAQELSCGAPALEAPTLGLADHSLTADDLLASAPVVEEPDLGQSHAMAPAEILAGVPELEAPTLGQIHGLTAAELAAGAPELGTPLMDIAGDDLTALDLLAGLPLLGEPALGQAPMPRTIAAVERGGIIGRYRP
jgi:hypothetical protein